MKFTNYSWDLTFITDVIYHVPPVDNPFNFTESLSASMGRIEGYNQALAITGCWQGSNRNKLYEVLGWESLS